MLKVDILMELFPKAVRTIVDLAGRAVTLVFFSYLTYYAYLAMMNSKKGGMVSPAMEMPMWLLYGSVFVGSALGVIRQIQDLYRFFFVHKEKKEEEKTC